MANVVAELNSTGGRGANKLRHEAPYLVFVLLISVLALVMPLVDMLIDSRSEVGRVLACVDTLLCVLFFGDFLYCLHHAENKKHYMLTWGWFDLLSSIPAVVVLRWGRAARVVRILRVMRGVRSARILWRFIYECRTQSAALAAAFAAMAAVSLASIAILKAEESAGQQANIRTAGDAIWWSVVTMTTVGYGDHFPVTKEGRFVAMMLMVSGVCLFGTLSGMAASWFLAPQEARQEVDLLALQAEIKALRELIEAGQRDKH